MLSALFGLAIGAAGGIEAAKAIDRVRARLRPHGGPTGMLLDKINRKLEESRAVDEHPSGDVRA